MTGLGNRLGKPEGLTGDILAPDGSAWHLDRLPPSNLSSVGELVALEATMDEAFYHRIQGQPVKVRGDLYLTLYGNLQIAKVPVGKRVRVPGVGVCSASGGDGAPYFLGCKSTLRPTANVVSVGFKSWATTMENIRAPSYSPFPAELGIDPLSSFVSNFASQEPVDAVTVETLEPLAYVSTPIRIDGLRVP